MQHPSPAYNIILILLFVVPTCCGLVALGGAIAYATRVRMASQPPSPLPLPTNTRILARTATQLPPATSTRPTSSLVIPTRTPTLAPTQAPIATSTQIPPTSTPPAASAPTACTCQGDTLNCGDFRSQAEAQACYLKCGGLTNDIYRLDGNNDGIACESTQY